MPKACAARGTLPYFVARLGNSMRDAVWTVMRTTLAIDDDVLLVARDLARQQRRSLGEVVSDLARKSLRSSSAAGSSRTMRSGILLLPVSNPDAMVTMEMVNALRDELE